MPLAAVVAILVTLIAWSLFWLHLQRGRYFGYTCSEVAIFGYTYSVVIVSVMSSSLCWLQRDRLAWFLYCL